MLGKKKEPQGAPGWVLTYGDMMSLLLTFFILLAAFADYDKNPSVKMVQALQSLQQALGLKVAGNHFEDQIDFNALIDKLKLAIRTGTTGSRGTRASSGWSARVSGCGGSGTGWRSRWAGRSCSSRCRTH